MSGYKWDLYEDYRVIHASIWGAGQDEARSSWESSTVPGRKLSKQSSNTRGFE